MFRLLAVLALFSASVCAAQPVATAASLSSPEWSRPFPPVHIVGNLYYVGTWDLSSYLITTPGGDILINSGLKDSVSQIRANIEQLGFKLSDVKIITLTHAHWDHAAGLSELKKLTNARVAVMEPDVSVMESGGKTDFRWGNDPGSLFDPVKVDEVLKPESKISLGGTVLTAHLHPGHTKGATSFTFNTQEDGKTYRVLIANFPTINPGVSLREKPSYPGIADDYARAFAGLKAMEFDVWVASHAGQFGLHTKYKPGDPYDPMRFSDKQLYTRTLANLERAFQNAK
jgi:metallo-beta-lactamase class B